MNCRAHTSTQHLCSRPEHALSVRLELRLGTQAMHMRGIVQKTSVTSRRPTLAESRTTSEEKNIGTAPDRLDMDVRTFRLPQGEEHGW